MEPRVTVVVPTYNRAAWLGAAIESVLAQTYPDFALVVSDNASTDGTGEVVASYDDPRLTYVRQPEHVGLNEHFNRCVALARSDYLFLLPDDDAMLPELLEATVPVLDEHPRVGLVHGRARIVGEDGAVIADGHDMTGLGRSAVEPGDDFARACLRGWYRVHASTALLRREALAGDGFDVCDYPATDFGLWLRLSLRWDVAFLDRTLAVYRVHGGSYTAGGAGVTTGGYVQRASMLAKVREVKLRFLAANAHRFPDVRDLRRAARRSFRKELVNLAGHETLPARKPGATLRTLADCARLDAAVLLEPGAWKLLAGSLLGPRAVDWIKRRRVARAAVAG